MADNATYAVEELLRQAKRLGLVPVYRTGTVYSDATTSGRAMVLIDNDTAPTPCFNYAGRLMSGTRVLVMYVKPHGFYVIGDSEIPPNPAVSSINQVGATDTTTSATFVNLAGSISLSFTKLRSDTNLEVDMRASAFITGSTNTKVSFAVQIDATDYEVVGMLINPASTHTFMAGVQLIPNIAAGTFTIQGRWRRIVGTATLSRNADDWISLKVRETF